MSALSAPVVTAGAADGPQLLLDPATVAANVRTVAATAGTAVMGVVKADGLGGGAEHVARTALAAGATWLGTATLAEAVAVRRAGIAAPLLCWLLPVDASWEAAMRLRIDVAISSVGHLRRLAEAAAIAGVRARVHLHVDTGMARDGAAFSSWPALCIEAFALARSIDVVGLMGHLPCADDPADASNDAGVLAFRGAIAIARAAGLRPSVLHLAATEAGLRLPAAAFDLVRVGAGLVGIGPGLTPALTLTAPVVMTRRVAAGTPVGYGHDARTERSTVLALLPLGYADGIPRRLAPGAAVQLLGRRCPVVGRVSMDQIVVDAGPTGVSVGATAIVFGAGRRGEPTVAEWAAWAGTIEHDIVAGIGRRVPRVLGGGA